MTGQDSKSKKDKSAVTPETWTDASMKSKEEKAYQLTKEEKVSMPCSRMIGGFHHVE